VTAGAAPPRFAERVVLITGASGGQGEVTARRLVEEGARVALGDLDGEALSRLAGGLDNAIAVPFDVAEEEGWARFVEAAREAWGRVDALVNNAGVYRPRALEETDLALTMDHFKANQLGPLLGARAVVPAMREAGGGSIVNISSSAALRGFPGLAAYSMTKWALRGLTQVAAVELAGDGIRVNTVLPGLIDTAMAKADSEEFKDDLIGRTPLGRIGLPEEVAAATCFLASAESSYITGAEVVVDGGATTTG
jgi:3alpha(or 20beta)-hydroxysteroid dehydrogenase